MGCIRPVLPESWPRITWIGQPHYITRHSLATPGRCLTAPSAFGRTIPPNSVPGTQTAHALSGSATPPNQPCLFPRPHLQGDSLNRWSAAIATTMAGASKPPTRASMRTDAPTAVGPTLGSTVPAGGIRATMLDHGPPLARTVRRAARPAPQHQATSTDVCMITLLAAQPLTTPRYSTRYPLYIFHLA